MGDVVSLVEKAAATIDQAEAEQMAAKMMAGSFDLEDMLSQLRQIKKMGDIKGLLGMLPGMGKMKKQIDDAKLDDKVMARQEAIILSMTVQERRRPELIKASRKRRIAAGSGMDVSDVNKLLKQHQQMAEMMKKMKKMGGKKGMMGALGGLFGANKMPDMPTDPDELRKLMGGAGGMPGLPPGMGGMGAGMPGGLPPDLLRAMGRKGSKKR
jgi:signal recognition particle subunit SRP54